MPTDKLKKTGVNLIPDTVNTSPDYFCTWQAQLYRCCNAGPQGQRDHMTEADIFGSGDEALDRSVGVGWAAHLYKKARRDLIFLMDDCWDVPLGGLKNQSPWYGSQILAKDKFPGFWGEGEAFDGSRNTAAMKQLSERVKSLGWRGIGGWICVQKSPLAGAVSDEEYWGERLRWANDAGWLYWKADWGNDMHKYEVRRLMTELRFRLAPNLIIEHALMPEIIAYADAYRTYDVFTLLAIPITLAKLEEDFAFDAAPGHRGYINCMDEVYIAAALGCSIDVTRHDMRGELPDGRPDPSFPALHRNLKSKTTEVLRTVRWHRIAPAFGVNGSETFIDPIKLTDYWDVVDQKSEIEAWWKYKDNDHIERPGPARISRGIAPASAEPASAARLSDYLKGEKAECEPMVPFIVSARHPSGAVSICTLARTQGRRCFTPLCEVHQEIGEADTVGIFGYFGSLTLYGEAVKPDSRVLMQDIAADAAYDVTAKCLISPGKLTIPGELISGLGRSENPVGDTSEPGVVVKII